MSQSIPNPKIRELAKRLVAYESALRPPSCRQALDGLRAAERLRRPLSALAGQSGFRALLSRALTLAKAQIPELRSVKVKPDGSLETSEPPLAGEPCREVDSEAGEVLVTELLGLLVALIGEALVVSLVRDEWPDLPAPDTESWSEATHDPAR